LPFKRRRFSGGCAPSDDGGGRDGEFVLATVAYCIVAPCLAGSSAGRRISRTVSGSEETLRRAAPSFTVEVRRRPRLATTLPPDAQSSETRSPHARFDRESHRASAVAFGAKEVDPSPVDVSSSPKGRILPSLAPEEPLRRTLRDAALTTAESDSASRAPKRPSVRTSKGKDQTSRLPRNSSFSSDGNAALAERLSTKSHRTASVQSDDGAGASPRVAPTVQSEVIGESGGLALSAKGRRRTIMARYVFGDELKPSERWKRRLLTSR
jgi:hypothetical protein